MSIKIPTETRTIKGLELLKGGFRNFSGSPTTHNPDGGKRYFNVRLDEELAKELREEGWNVKERPPNAEYDQTEPLWFLKVAFGFKGPRPPRMIAVTAKGRTPLTEETVDTLDMADIEFANIIIRPYNWDNGKSRVAAYLQTGFFHIQLDELEMMYELDDEEQVTCDEDGICYIAATGVRVN